MIVSAVEGIHNASLASQLIDDGLNVVMCGRWFQKNPGLVYAFADELDTDVKMADQISWGSKGGARKQQS